jgi:hypothetical protein
VNLSITIPDAQAQRVVDALSEAAAWKPTLEDGSPNPETKAQAAKRYIIERIKAQVRSYEAIRLPDDLTLS